MTQANNIERSFILQAMVSMAVADGNVPESKAASISSLYAQVTGDVVRTDEITSAPRAYRRSEERCVGKECASVIRFSGVPET